MNSLNEAIAAAGGIQCLAKALDISYQAVQKWRARGHPPAKRCLDIERLTGVSRHDLRPDIYGPAFSASAGGARQHPPQGFVCR